MTHKGQDSYDVSIRPARYADRFALARVIIDATRSAFRGRVPDRCLDWLTVEESAANWGRNFENGVLGRDKYLLVAEVGRSDVIGFALAVRRAATTIKDLELFQDYPAELLSLQVDPAWQRHGVGHQLVAEIAARLAQEGESKLLVGVLADNPNRAFYETLGARLAGSRPFVWEGYQTEELIYVWDNIDTI